MADEFKDWLPGDPAYTAPVVAGNFRAIRKMVTDLLSSNGRDLIVGMTQVGRRLTFQTTAGLSLTGATLPLAPVTPKGERVVGRWYEEGELYRDYGSSYIVLVGHNATGNLAGDIAAGKVALHASRGTDAERLRGEWSATTDYSPQDVVYVTNPFDHVSIFYKAYSAVPAGGAPPNGSGNPWAQHSFSPVQTATLKSRIPVSVLGPIQGGSAILWHCAVGLNGFLPANLAGCSFMLLVAPTADLTLTLRKKGFAGQTALGSAVATITFAAGSRTGAAAVIVPGGGVPLQANDMLILTGPAAADATASGLGAWMPFDAS